MMETLLNVDESRVKALFEECITKIRYTEDNQSKWFVFDNQIETAKDIIFNFYTKQNRWCLLFAEMQSGKSGTFFSIPYIISRNLVLTKKLGIDMWGSEVNTYLLTGMNEKELIEQFETDIASFTGMDIKKNILHNSEMRKFLSRPEKDWTQDDLMVINRMRKNSLILIDESHYGSDKEQILNQFLTKILGISPNGDNIPLTNNNQYVVSISATPMAEFVNANQSNVGFKKKIVPLKNADGYYGICEMFENGKVYKAYDLRDNKSVDSFIDTILDIEKNGYVLIRTGPKQKERIKERLASRLINFGSIDYDQHSKLRILDKKDINDLLENNPDKKTLVFLKGLLRAGKRVNTKNVIMVHDTSESKVDTTVQSLLGRCCGYNKNQDIKIYCDFESALKYKNWVESGYDIKLVPNKSKNIKGANEVITKSFHKSKVFDCGGNETIVKVMAYKSKSVFDRIILLKSLNDHTINEILTGLLHTDYEVGSIFKVNKNKNNTSYKKQYLDMINTNTFIGDFKVSKEDLGKKIISACFEETEQKLVVSVGVVVENEIYVDEKSMFHKTNVVEHG